MTSRVQCSGTTQQDQRCKIMINADDGYCRDHKTQKPLPIQALPPDVLREVVRNLPIREILRTCRANKQFNTVICNNLAFWRDLARQRHILFADETSLSEIKHLLYSDENEHIVHHNPYLYLIDPEDPPENSFEPDISDFSPYTSTPLETLLIRIIQQYNVYYNDLGSDAPDDLDKVLTPEKYREEITKWRQMIKEYDTIYFDRPNFDPRGSDRVFFVYTDELSGQMMVKEAFLGYTRYHNTIYIPTEGIQMFQDIADMRRQPLTQNMLSTLYEGIFTGVGILLPSDERLLIGDKTDPIKIFRGITMHLVES